MLQRNVNSNMKGLKLHDSNQFGQRSKEIRAVGAWVQPETAYYGHHSEAVVSAEVEQHRMERKLREKEERLRRFQSDVRNRVRTLNKLKRQQQLEKSSVAVELESDIVKQSTFAAERHTPRKDRCSVRDEGHLRINMKPALSTQGGVIRTPGAGGDAFEEQLHQVHKYNRQARRQLCSRKVITEQFVPDDLPGGVWKVSSTLDHPATRSTIPPEVFDIEEDEDEFVEYGEIPEPDRALSPDPLRGKLVRFDLQQPTEETRKDRIGRKSVTQISGSDIHRNVPNIYPGVLSEEDKKRAVTQRAMYRRLFMDIEREQVKENLRRKEHRVKIAKLKKEKEESRRREENRSYYLIEPKDPVTGETQEEAFRREVEMERQAQEALEHISRHKQKQREMNRYLEALKRSIKEKIERRGIVLPPLCCCGETVWDTHPDTCANNCVFYKNPKAYAKALQSLLVSCDVVL
ncbi:coiled-coil domain-containing protein 15-like [Lingula anatina]|uniref:Coiled-coil domain-containing protein 15-like n=1 Tax=Lingula anatina TaxID=7574 RepID=A0A1S3JZI3_LINAN|nr:coiled-coil domain-containing protein 15-like [Lingula anatina]|eukprot:XP_013415514.1 coiled-coil domain-containing protein 15-like [Lingula anatina]